MIAIGTGEELTYTYADGCQNYLDGENEDKECRLI